MVCHARLSVCLPRVSSPLHLRPPHPPFPQIQVTHKSVLRRVLRKGKKKKNHRHFLTPSCTPPVFQRATFDARVALEQRASAYYHSPSWVWSASLTGINYCPYCLSSPHANAQTEKLIWGCLGIRIVQYWGGGGVCLLSHCYLLHRTLTVFCLTVCLAIMILHQEPEVKSMQPCFFHPLFETYMVIIRPSCVRRAYIWAHMLNILSVFLGPCKKHPDRSSLG